MTRQFPTGPRPSVFLSHAQADLEMAKTFESALEKQCEVFLDSNMEIGSVWYDRVSQALSSADLFVVLVSSNSVGRDWVHAEVEEAWRRHQDTGRPVIAPVRLAYQAALRLPLSGFLNKFHHARWTSADDTERIVGSILARLPSANETADSTPDDQFVEPDDLSQVFLEREFEQRAKAAARRKGVTVVIKAPRQVGKTHLLDVMEHAARDCGKRIARLDFQYLDSAALQSGAALFQHFCRMLASELGVKAGIDQVWKNGLAGSLNTVSYLNDCVLKEVREPVFFAIDEVERIYEPSGLEVPPQVISERADFLRMLRNWHEMRNPRVDTPWNRLDLVLATSTEPYLLIPDGKTSPFNVSQAFHFPPPDFTESELRSLNEAYGKPIRRTGDLYALLSGHPALTQEAFFVVRAGQWTEDRMLQEATSDSGPFASHLRYYMYRLHQVPNRLEAFCRLVRYREQPDKVREFSLLGAGLIRETADGVVPRNRLYADYFRTRLKC